MMDSRYSSFISRGDCIVWRLVGRMEGCVFFLFLLKSGLFSLFLRVRFIIDGFRDGIVRHRGSLSIISSRPRLVYLLRPASGKRTKHSSVVPPLKAVVSHGRVSASYICMIDYLLPDLPGYFDLVASRLARQRVEGASGQLQGH